VSEDRRDEGRVFLQSLLTGLQTVHGLLTERADEIRIKVEAMAAAPKRFEELEKLAEAIRKTP
jgi:hypothetical protein